MINASASVAYLVSLLLLIGGYDKSMGKVSTVELYVVYEFFRDQANINGGKTVPFVPINIFPFGIEVFVTSIFKQLNIVSETHNRVTSYRGFTFKDPCFSELANFLNSGTITTEEGLKRVHYLYARCIVFLYKTFDQPALFEVLGDAPPIEKFQETIRLYEKTNGEQIVAHVSLQANIKTLEAPSLDTEKTPMSATNPIPSAESESSDEEDNEKELSESDEMISMKAEIGRIISDRQEQGVKGDDIEDKLKAALEDTDIKEVQAALTSGRKSRSALRSSERSRREKKQAKKKKKK